MPEHQKVQQRSQKTQSIQDNRRNLQKESTAAKEKMRKLHEELKQIEERVLFLSNNIDQKKDAGCRNGGSASEFAGGRRKKMQ